MLSFKQNTYRFNYRVAGIVIQNGRLLVHKGIKETFWALPGGRCEWMEMSAMTLEREFVEELNVKVSVGKLAFFAENFFEYNGEKTHELGLYYPVTPLGKLPTVEKWEVFESNTLFIFKWVELEELAVLDLKPAFLKKYMQNLPQNMVHVVEGENQ